MSAARDRQIGEFSLGGRVAVVTGAGSGIGRATAEAFAAAGAKVFCWDLSEEGARTTVEEIGRAGGSAQAMTVNVADRAAVEAAVAGVLRTEPGIDVLSNCAGIATSAPALELTDEELDRNLAVNLRGTLHTCQAVGRGMVAAGRGSIVNIASVAIDGAFPNNAAYAISKAGIAQLTKGLAVELAPKGVRVNAIAPGFIDTPMTQRWDRGEDGELDPARPFLAKVEESIPVGFAGEPHDIAMTGLFLAADASRFMTGQVLRPNGGVTMPG